MPKNEKPAEAARPGKAGASRAERLAAELRENLKKRKEQARARAQKTDSDRTPRKTD